MVGLQVVEQVVVMKHLELAVMQELVVEVPLV